MPRQRHCALIRPYTREPRSIQNFACCHRNFNGRPMGHQTAARSSSSLRSHPDVALCCQCAQTVSSLHFSLVGWFGWWFLFVCLPVPSLLLPHNRLRFLTRPVLSQSSEGISPSFSYSYCCLPSAVSLLVSCGFVVARRNLVLRLLFLVGRLPFSQSLFFLLLSLFGTTTPPPPPSLFSRTL
jgi:hypothetical protein